MGYKTITTKIASARSTKSKQTTSYQYPTGNGVVLTGSSINSQTSAYLDVTTPGAARTFTAVSGGAGTSTLISNIQYLDANNVVANAIAASTTGGNILINGNGFANTSRVYVNNQLVTNTFVNSNAIIATLSANSVGNVTLAVFNSSGQSGVFSNSNVRFSGAPSWVTAAAVSSVNGVASNIALQASGDGTLTYSLKSGSGSLPTGITLLSSGYLTGTATGYSADTVVSFTLIVSDPESQETQQNFNYTVIIGDTYFKQTSLLLSATVSNTFISDSSTNNFLITRNGDTRPSRFSPYWPGGWSGYFDGNGDYLSIAHSTPLNLSSGDFTVEGWFYCIALTASSQQILNKDGTFNASYSSYSVYITSSGVLSVDLGNGGGTNPTATTYTGSSVTLNTWNHFALVKSGTTITIYQNGLQTLTTSQGLSITDGGKALLVGYQTGQPSGQYFNGYISNIRILKGTAQYTANFTPSTTSLTTVANTSLITLRDSILSDDSPSNSTITRNGDAKLTTFSPFNTSPHTITANSYSVYFDGSGDSLTLTGNAAFAFGTGDFTVECWINSNSVTSGIFDTRTTVSSTTPLIYSDSTGVRYYVNGAVVITGSVLPLNTWVHIALVRASGTLKLYINGNQSGSSYADSNNYTLTNTVYIGNTFNSSQQTNGWISNFRIVKGTAVYTANFTPSTSALTAISGTSVLACQANTIIDSNTTAKTITVNGNPNVGIANPFGETVTTISNYTWSPTSYGASAYFDGTGDYLTAPNNSAFEFGTGNVTLEAFVYRTTIGTADTILQYGRDTVTNYDGISWAFYITSGNFLSFEMSNGVSSTYLTLTSSLAFPANTWTHVALIRTGNNFILYQNGVSVATGSTAQSFYIPSSSLLFIGRNHSAGTADFAGYISDVRIVKGTALYTTSFIPPAAPLPNVANVSLLTLQSDIGSNSAQFVDQSPNNYLITRNGNASQGTFGPLVPSTWSAYFDGTGDYLTSSSTDLRVGTSAFTYEAWVYITSTATSGLATFFSYTDTGGSIRVFFTLTPAAPLVNFWVYQSQQGSTSIGLTRNTWNHVAVVRDASNVVKIYINGNSYFSTSLSTDFNGGTFSIGGEGGGNNPFTGYISNFRLVKGSALYTANFTPSTTTISPVANTSILTLRGPAFRDDSGNNFSITRNGDTKIVPFGPFSPQIVTPDSYSYRFSNVSDYISTTSSNLAFGSNNWTIESWVYPRFTANSGIFQVSNVQYGLTNSNLNTIAMGFSSTNKAIVRVANATYTSTGTSITANTWTHLALVKSSNISKLYINGTLDSTIGTSGSITDTVSYTGTTNVAVGGYASTSALANAYISNFRVVSNSAVYTENFTPAVGPLSAISGTTLLTCQANTVIDSSAANLTITANANVSPSSFNPFDETVTVGQQYSELADGGSAYFDGTGDYLTVAGGMPSGASTAFTFECWVYLSNLSDYRVITRGTTSNQLDFGIQANGSVKLDNTGVGAICVTSASLITANNWQHIALVRTSNNIYSIYIDGILRISSSAYATSITENTTIGYSSFSAAQNFVGYMSGVRVVKGTSLYTSNFVPPAAPALPTVANTSLLLNFTSSGVIDSTGRNILETVADAKVTTNLKKYGTGSYYFDGTGDYLSVMGNSTELAFGTGDFTVEFWIYTSNAAQSAVLYDSRPSATQGLYPTIYIASNILYYYNNSADRITGGTLVNNTWHHVALARSGTSTKMFLDGTQVGSTYTDSSNYLNSSGKPIIGNNNGPTSPYLGYISDLRITKGYARYTANFTVPSEPFILK